MYKTREYRQEDISEEMGLPISVVRKVLQNYNYERTKLKTKDNLCGEQKVFLGVWFDKMDYLDKYIQ